MNLIAAYKFADIFRTESETVAIESSTNRNRNLYGFKKTEVDSMLNEAVIRVLCACFSAHIKQKGHLLSQVTLVRWKGLEPPTF